MQILFLTQIIPWPLDAGPKIKTWNVLRFLKEQGHTVILGSFVREEERKHLIHLEQLCEEVHAVPMRRSRPADLRYWLRSQLSGRPFLIERDDLPEMRALVARLVAEKGIDLIYADQLSMVQFGLPKGFPDGKRPFLLFDAHNAVWTIVDRMQQNAAWFLKPVLAQEARKIKKYEGKIVKTADHVLAVSENDCQALLEAVAATSKEAVQSVRSSITVIPIAVDTSTLTPVQRKPGSTNILTLGTLHYPPNADGIRWFMKEVFPILGERVPSATLTVVGKNPPGDFLQMAAKDSRITVTGYVPDLTPYFEAAAVVVVPVRAGGGMRVRILEAFARGIPIVTTTVGLEGIEARIPQDVEVADSPEAFASAVERLLLNPVEQEQMARNCRQVAEDRYDWRVILKKLEGVLSLAESKKDALSEFISI